MAPGEGRSLLHLLLPLLLLLCKEHSLCSGSLFEQNNLLQQDDDIYITVTYMGASGNFRVHKINSKNLSSSWVWESKTHPEHKWPINAKLPEIPLQQTANRLQENLKFYREQNQQKKFMDLAKHMRQQSREAREYKRSAELIQMSEETELQMQKEAVKRSKEFKNTIRTQYSIWKKEYYNPNSDSILKLTKDQIIMAKVYASIARSANELNLYTSLMRSIKQSQYAIADASSDTEVQHGTLEQAKAMGRALFLAKEKLLDCDVVARKLRAMLQSMEDNMRTVKKENSFLLQHALKTMPKPFHCFSLQLTADYFLTDYTPKDLPNIEKLENPSLYHYAIFSDNVLATSVVVNSAVGHAKEPEKHVFHIVTDKLNFAAIKMWFMVHPPSPATIHVENIDDFKWLNSSYCSVLRQLESTRIKEYYFKSNHPSSLSAADENLKYRNPKYLSILNHLRFYIPELYPKLKKILFLDDDIVVQKDLTPLWSVDMKGMVNGAVETCKESFHRFDTYLNFSNPIISKNFDPQACGWAFGMNIFDLKKWKEYNITGIYHYWQDLNDDRILWKLGSLPPGLIAFYNLTFPLNRRWHVLGLGYDHEIPISDIEKAGVIHYNGNFKPWHDLSIAKYKPYWSKYVNYDNPYIRQCFGNK